MDISFIAASKYFDRKYYVKTYCIPEDTDPAAHYVEFGAKLCYDPSESFSTVGYLLTHPELINANTNPLFYYEKYGKPKNEQVISSAALIDSTELFDPYYYIKKNMGGGEHSEIDAASDYINRGWKSNLSVNVKLDLTKYVSSLPDEMKKCIPLLHYILYIYKTDDESVSEKYRKSIGIIEKSKYFDEKYYRETYGISRLWNAARHYYVIGAKKMYDPSELFSTSGYLFLNNDSVDINALIHYETVGKTENRFRIAADNPFKNKRSSVVRLSKNNELKISFFEERLYELVSKYSEAQQSDFLKNSSNPFYFNALSELRSNCVEWLPVSADDTVLIFGSGYGEIVPGLASKCGKLVCFDTNEISTAINEMKNRDYDNIKFFTAENAIDFFDAFKSDKFDFIIITESFGNAADYFPHESDPQLKLLKEARTILSERGKLVIACDNPYGLKYFNGSLSNNGYFSTITGEHGFSTPSAFTKAEINDYVRKAGFPHCKFYYPFPDYHISFSIFTDLYTPKSGELSAPEYTWENDKLYLFDEKKACAAAAQRGCFDVFSNSYIVVMSLSENDDNLLYVKYSNDRNEGLRIKTEIRQMPNGEKSVSKIPLSEFSKQHIKKLYKNYKKLCDVYANTNFRFNTCEYSLDKANFQFVEGKSLYIYILEQIKNENLDGAILEFNKIRDFLMINSTNFVESRKFKTVFGNVKLPANLAACPISNVDLILQNIIIDKCGVYNVLDYEWTFDFSVPISYILYRSIRYMDIACSDEIPMKFIDDLYFNCGITEELYTAYNQMEVNFQNYILSGHMPVRNMQKNGHIFLFEEPLQIYEDYGCGFKPPFKKSNAVLYPNGKISAKIYVNEDICRLRIDPCSSKCIVKVLSIKDNRGNLLQYTTNGTMIGENCYMYNHNDPFIVLDNLNLQSVPAKFQNSDNYSNNYIDINLEVLQFTENIRKSV